MKASIDYGAELKRIINEQHINRVELAKEYGCTPGNVQKAMNNKGMKRDTFDGWMRAIEFLEAKKENQRLQDKLRRIKEILEE